MSGGLWTGLISHQLQRKYANFILWAFMDLSYFSHFNSNPKCENEGASDFPYHFNREDFFIIIILTFLDISGQAQSNFINRFVFTKSVWLLMLSLCVGCEASPLLPVDWHSSAIYRHTLSSFGFPPSLSLLLITLASTKYALHCLWLWLGAFILMSLCLHVPLTFVIKLFFQEVVLSRLLLKLI